MKFVTSSEIKSLSRLIEFLNRLESDLVFDCKAYDVNGDVVGVVGPIDGGEYGFILEGLEDS